MRLKSTFAASLTFALAVSLAGCSAEQTSVPPASRMAKPSESASLSAMAFQDPGGVTASDVDGAAMTVGPVEDGYTVIVEQPSIPGGREAAVAFRLADKQGEIVKGLPEDSVTASAVHHGLTTTATAPAVRGKGGRWTIALPVLPDGPYSLLVRLARPGEAPVELRGAFTIGSFTGAPEVTEAERLSDASAAGFTARLVGERPSGKRSLVSVVVSEGQKATVSGIQDAAMGLFGGSDGAQYASGSLVKTESGASASFRVPPLPAGRWAVLVSGTVGGDPVEFHFVVSVK